MNSVQPRLISLILCISLGAACQGASVLPTVQPFDEDRPAPTATPTSIPPAYDEASQPAEVSAYRMKLRLTTTSDWTRVIFEGATMAVTGQEIIEGSDAPELKILGLPEIVLSKQGLDQTKVVVEFEVYLAEVEAASLRIAIGKGHIGSTTVELSNFNQDQPHELTTLNHSGVANPNDPLNRRFFSISTQALAEGGARRLSVRSYPKTVLAFYYPWYATPEGPTGEWRVWDVYPPIRTPLLGFYDVYNPATVARQIGDAQTAGIDGFIVSWWGIDHFTDRALRQTILPVAEQERFAVTIYYENYGQNREQIARDFAYISEEYGQSPAFMRVDGRPVLFVYDMVTTAFNKDDWDFVFQRLDAQGLDCFCIADGLVAAYNRGDAQYSYLFDLFQGVHTYFPLDSSPEFLYQLYASNALKAAAKGILFAATVSPGFDNSSWAPADGKAELVVDRNGGQLYRQIWEAAIASNPQWILITSFNEWPEGTEIEPSREFGQQYLQLTSELVAVWKR